VPGHPGRWAAFWSRFATWVASRDLARIELSILAGVHIGLGLALLVAPPELRYAVTFEILFDGDFAGLEFRVLWALAFLVSGVALTASCIEIGSWTLQHIAWGIAIPVMAMWVTGLSLALRNGPGSLTGPIVYGAITLFHLTTAVRLWHRST
jgi:hypothetical protein